MFWDKKVFEGFTPQFVIISVQFKKNDGKCGVCGDDWSKKRPRENENGGHYGTGTITEIYMQGQIMDVEVELTTNHWGIYISSVFLGSTVQQRAHRNKMATNKTEILFSQ